MRLIELNFEATPQTSEKNFEKDAVADKIALVSYVNWLSERLIIATVL